MNLSWVYCEWGGSSLTNYCVQILQIGDEDTMAEGGICGSITSFNSEQEELVNYVKRVESYFIMNTINGNEKKKVQSSSME